jgi:hypothetical protein
LIKACINGNHSLDFIKSEAQQSSNCILTTRSWSSAISILQNGFLKVAEKAAFGNISYVKLSNNGLSPTDDFKALLENRCYKSELEDILSVGLAEYKKQFIKAKNKTQVGNLVVNSKYSRKDACRLLNWTNNEESTIYGYKMDYDTNTCPIFITYDKDTENISGSTNYQDKFINEETFEWFSRNKRTTSSEELQGLINQANTQTRAPLFVKKSDGEGTDFYYLGDLNTISAKNSKIEDKGKQLDIVRFSFHLTTPIDENLLNYLDTKPTGNIQSDLVNPA